MKQVLNRQPMAADLPNRVRSQIRHDMVTVLEF